MDHPSIIKIDFQRTQEHPVQDGGSVGNDGVSVRHKSPKMPKSYHHTSFRVTICESTEHPSNMSECPSVHPEPNPNLLTSGKVFTECPSNTI